VPPDSLLAAMLRRAHALQAGFDAIINLNQDWLAYYLSPFFETPLLHAAKCTRLRPLRRLLQAGADPDFVDTKGMTALHYLLKKGSALALVEALAEHGARGDIRGPDGRTGAEILRRKRDPRFVALAARLRA